MIDALAFERHHADHIAPVWRALPEGLRGRFHVPAHVAGQLAARGVVGLSTDEIGPGGPVLVSASRALNEARRAGREHVALMEHGAGQSFHGDKAAGGRLADRSPSYAGGDGRDAELFLFPGEHPAAAQRASTPDARVVVVGSPRLDELPARVPDGVPTAAFSFHWDTSLSPETRSSFIIFRDALARFAAAADGVRVIGHGHPRIIDRLEPWYARHGIEVARDFDDVCRRADVYACDGMSTLYEFASTGRPVVVLNGPWYRRHIEHGLRFWAAAGVGANVDDPRFMAAAVRAALADPGAGAAERERALDMVYAYRTGAAARAAAALAEWAASVKVPA